MSMNNATPPADYAPEWEMDIRLADEADRPVWLGWLIVLQAVQLSLGIAIGVWIA